jgi:hypothetical protein
VTEGRAALNYSEWDRPQEGEEAAGTVAEGEMPPLYYRPFARMSAGEKADLVNGLTATFGGRGGLGGRGDGD